MNNLLAIKHYDATRVILIRQPKDDMNLANQFIQHMEASGHHVESLTLNIKRTNDLSKLNLPETASGNGNRTIFVLPSVHSIVGYQLISLLQDELVTLCYVEDDGDIWEKKNHGFAFVGDSTNIDISDYILSRGGIITSDTTILFGHQRMIDFLDYIESNFRNYTKLFRRNQSSGGFHKSYPDNKNKLILLPDLLNNHEKKILDDFLTFMRNHDIIKINQRLKSRIIISFKHKSYKSYLLKTGTWLEHRCYELMKEAGCDEVEASLSFLWDKKRKAGNEIDVVALKDNQLVVISCKDRKQIDPHFINELYTNAIHLGNEAAIKILFTTARPSKGLLDKAKEFGIHIITYEFNRDETLHQIKKILNLNKAP